jgi:mono/diheme cytochrome c family protein
MRSLSAVAFALAGLTAAPVAFATPAVADGQALYQARCAMCHGTGMGGAPLMEKLATLDPLAVVEKMTTGTMAAMASGISDANKRDIAVFITRKDLPAKDGLPAVSAQR